MNEKEAVHPELAVRALQAAYDTKREYPQSRIEIKATVAADLLDYITELEKLVREIPLQVNDRVIEVGSDEPSGTIIDIREVNDEPVYEVKLDKPSKHFTTIMYYQNEIQLYERAK